MEFEHKTFRDLAGNTLEVPDCLDRLIAVHKKEGWEFVSHSTLFIQSNINVYAVFKRPQQ